MTEVLVEKILSEEQMGRVDEAINRISGGTMSFVEYIETLRDKFRSKEKNLHYAAVDELVACFVRLSQHSSVGIQPKKNECEFVLEFLLCRMDDCAHLSDLLIFGIHFLALSSSLATNLTVDQVGHIMGMFEAESLQSYGQRDRTLLFVLFEHMIDSYSDMLKSIEPQRPIMLFLKAANGEREPHVLMIVFRIFQKIVKNFSLGPYIEDMFNLIACYFPIDYEPVDDSPGQITADMLTSSCESALLSSALFAPYCFQLAAEKLVDDVLQDDADGLDRQIMLCEFLTTCCETFDFEENGIENYLEEFTTAFRLIFVNPVQSTCTLEKSRIVVSKAAKALVNLLRKTKGSDDSMLKMANMYIENLEPFVLQSEMGIIGRALYLLECVSHSDLIIKKAIVPKVVYWLRLVVSGSTLRSEHNKEDTIESITDHLVTWFKLASEIHTDCEKLIDSLIELFVVLQNQKISDPEKNRKFSGSKFDCLATLVKANVQWNEKLENFCGSFFLQVLEECNPSNEYTSLAFCTNHSYLLAVRQFVKIYNDTCNDKQRIFIRDSLFKFAKEGSENAQMLFPALITYPKNENFEANSMTVKSIISFCLISQRCDILIETLNTLLIYEQRCENMEEKILTKRLIDVLIFELQNFLLKYLRSESHLDDLNTIVFAELLQDVGSIFLFNTNGVEEENKIRHYNLLKWAHEFFSNGTTNQEIINSIKLFKLFILQTEFLEELVSITSKTVQILETEIPNVNDAKTVLDWFLSLYFMIVNRDVCVLDTPSQPLIELRTKIVNSSVDLNISYRVQIAEAKASLLASSSKGIYFLKKLFGDFYTWKITCFTMKDLLDLKARTSSPIKCFICTTPTYQHRMICQFVPIYVETFNTLQDANKKAILLELVEPLLEIASTLPPSSITKELWLLIPILSESLLELGTRFDDKSQDVVVKGIIELLKTKSMLPRIPPDLLANFVRSFKAILESNCGGRRKTATQLEVLECLALVGQHVESRKLVPFWSSVLQCLSKLANDKRRAIRQKAAFIRNIWEVTFG